MSNIERLFGGERAVPGMRQSGRFAARAPIARAPVPAAAPVESDAQDAPDAPVDAKVMTPHLERVADAHEVRDAADADDAAADGTTQLDAYRDRQDGELSSAALDFDVGMPAEHDGGAAQQLVAAQAALLRPSAVLRIAHEPFHPHSEQVRLLRTELLLRHSVWGEANAVALVSACPGEGRSQLAAELALAFAQLDRPTLLVDADFRRPRQHALFGADLDYGLAPALAVGGSGPAMHGVEGFPRLSLVTAGVCPPNPLELLTDRRFEALMDEWRHRFDFIVVDTPPITDFADGLAVATIVGRVLTVNRARHTPYVKAREMLRRLAASDAVALGGVLNHF